MSGRGRWLSGGRLELGGHDGVVEVLQCCESSNCELQSCTSLWLTGVGLPHREPLSDCKLSTCELGNCKLPSCELRQRWRRL